MKFDCEHCGQKLEAEDSWINMEFECPTCNNSITALPDKFKTETDKINKTSPPPLKTSPPPLKKSLHAKKEVYCRNCKEKVQIIEKINWITFCSFATAVVVIAVILFTVNPAIGSATGFISVLIVNSMSKSMKTKYCKNCNTILRLI